MKSEKKKKHHHHHHHHHQSSQSSQTSQLESPIKLPIELSLLESDIIPQPEPATLSPTYTLSPARYESPPRVDHGSSNSSALASPTSPKSPTSPTSSTSPTLGHRKVTGLEGSELATNLQDGNSPQSASVTSNNSEKEEARTIFPMYFASDQSAMGSGLDRPRTESLPALEYPYLSSCSSSSSSSSSANPFSKTPSEQSILSSGASWGPSGVLSSTSSSSQNSSGRGFFSSKSSPIEPNQLSSLQQLPPASSKNQSKEKNAYGASSLTRGAKCFLVKERKVAKSKRTSTTSNRNLVLVTDINGISLVQPFTEVLVAHYPFKEIKLWKSSATFFYFLWYPPGSKKDSQGVPFLYETVVGDEIMKALEESVQKALIRRRQGLLEP